MRTLRTFQQATFRMLLIFISLPTATWAGIKIDNNLEIDHTLSIKVFSLAIASLCGGISSSFVKTSFDDGIKNINVFKIFVGTCLGTFSGLAIIDNSAIGIFSIILPVFIIASLGAPIMVFYLMWLSSAETQAEIKEKIKDFAKKKLGMDNDRT